MKVSVLQENLSRGLNIVGRAVSSRSALQILSNVLVKAEDGRLRLEATNLEMGIACWVGAKVEEEGAITVPARTFSDLVGTLPREPILLQTDERTVTLHVTCGPTASKIKGIGAEEFPEGPNLQPDGGLMLPVDTLREVIGQVAFAAATDDTRPVLTGILVQMDGDALNMVASDGFRLALRSVEMSGEIEQPVNLIVPARALVELARICGDQEGDAEIVVSPDRAQVLFHMGDVDLVSQLIDGKYPDYSAIIPTDYATRVVIGTAEFLQACKRADIFAREAANTVRLHITPGGGGEPGRMVITATSQETGENQGVLTAAVEGEEIEIGFNVRYLMDALNVISTEQVALETRAPERPGVIRPVGGEDFVYVLMPIQLAR